MNKRNKKLVGATSSRPHFEEIAKYNKGITLIALIITIIVMLILVGVTVNVALNGGLFDTAKQAASGMNMAQIQERAEMVKYMLEADIETGKITGSVKTEYLNRLKTEFGVTDNEIKNNKIVVADNKYDIVIKNADLDIEVREHTNYVDKSSILSLNYRTSSTEVDGKIYATTMYFDLGSNFTQGEYVQLKKEEELANTTVEQKRESVLEVLSAETGTEITSIDEYMLLYLNSESADSGIGPHDTIEEYLEDEDVRTELGVAEGEELTKGQLYNAFLNGDISKELTEEEILDGFYLQANGLDYGNDYINYTNSLKVFIEDNGVEKSLSSNTVFVWEDRDLFSYSICKNGTYEFVIKDQKGIEILREKIVINNIETINNPVIVPEDGEWSVISSQVGRYLGNYSNVIVPLQIGDTRYIGMNHSFDAGDMHIYDFVENVIVPEGITSLGASSFRGCTNLKSVTLPSTLKSVSVGVFNKCSSLEKIILPDSVTYMDSCFNNCTSLKEIHLPSRLSSIMTYTFENCTSLTEITIPSSVTLIGNNAFSGCTNLTNIYVEAGSTLTIPETKPWGAPNATVTVLPAE